MDISMASISATSASSKPGVGDGAQPWPARSAVTFEPHPRSFSAQHPARPLAREANKRPLGRGRLAGAVVMAFDKGERPAPRRRDFIHRIDRPARHQDRGRLRLPIFGKGRSRIAELLVSEGPRLGIEVDGSPHVDIEERPVSQSNPHGAAEGDRRRPPRARRPVVSVRRSNPRREARPRTSDIPRNMKTDRNAGLKTASCGAGRPQRRCTASPALGARPPRQRAHPAGSVFVRFKGDLYGAVWTSPSRLHPR